MTATTGIIKFERILCPTDLSPASDEALRYAVALARAYDAKLYVAHCVDAAMPADFSAVPRTSRRPVTCGGIEGVFEESIEQHLSGRAAPPLRWEGLYIESDNIGESITRDAAERGVDLIVMRSRRRPRAARLLGSTAEAVSRTAPCPVLVTHSDELEWVGAPEDINLRRVLVAYDFSGDSELALRHGLSLAQEYQAELHILHVVSDSLIHDLELARAKAGADGRYWQAAQRLMHAVPAEKYPWCEVKHAVQWGKPYREVLSYAEDQQINLICMGANGAGFGMSALFGSNVDRVLRQAPCPVLIARPLRPEPRRAL